MTDRTNRDVLGSLPNSRPSRRSGKRAAAPATPAEKTARAATPGAAPRRARRAATRTPEPRPSPPPSGWASSDESASSAPNGLELAGTAVRAVGELAQIGATAGGQAVRALLRRLPG